VTGSTVGARSNAAQACRETSASSPIGADAAGVFGSIGLASIAAGEPAVAEPGS
jgi:hypothetical protein